MDQARGGSYVICKDGAGAASNADDCLDYQVNQSSMRKDSSRKQDEVGKDQAKRGCKKDGRRPYRIGLS